MPLLSSDRTTDLFLGLGAMIVVGGVAVAVPMGALTVLVGLALLTPGTPQAAASLTDVIQTEAVVQVEDEAVVAKQVAAAKPAAAPTRSRSTAKKKRTRSAPSRALRRAPAEDEVAMSVQELRAHLGSQQAETVPAARTPVPVSSPPSSLPAPVVAPQPPPVAAVAAAPRAPARARPAPAPVRRPAPPTPAAAPSMAGRSIVSPDGHPLLDPVAVDVITDVPGVAVLVDGIELGRTPMKLLMEAGSHDLELAHDKASASFTLAAGTDDRWCFSAKGKEIKTTTCRRRG
jgi:hypothetical protein